MPNQIFTLSTNKSLKFLANMITFVCKSSTFIAFLCLALLLSSTNGIRSMEEIFCGKPSGLWEGPCFRDAHCDKQCREKEDADNGICSGYKCWCRKKCGNVCGKPSGIWKGPCFKSGNCDKQCRQKENALFGSCSGLFKCLCRYDC